VHLESFDVHEDEDLIVLHVEASHFLWKMVRRLVGVLVEVGLGQMPPADAAGLFDADPRTVAPLTAPASGLFLERVYYKNDPRDAPLRGAVRIAKAE
jgi:tRNA pseudouridine38-40 synthase